MTMSNPNWLKDELILALDLYFDIDFSHNRNERNAKIDELSHLLNSLPLHAAHFRGEDFRNPTGVYMKLSNFLRFDPNYPGKGLNRGSKLDEAVWEEFASNLPKLRRTAELIRSSHSFLSKDQALPDDTEEEEFSEGSILTTLHRRRERNSTLVKKKKRKVIAETGKLLCEVCSFDFYAIYGELGKGYAECHHTVPLSSLKPNTKTKMSDLAIVCANCHRMLHKSKTWLTTAGLRQLIVNNGPAEPQ
jgi:5-methylcytosine-specific restriction protein A